MIGDAEIRELREELEKPKEVKSNRQSLGLESYLGLFPGGDELVANMKMMETATQNYFAMCVNPSMQRDMFKSFYDQMNRMTNPFNYKFI